MSGAAEPVEVEGPAYKQSGYFAQDRHLSKGIGSPMGWSRLHPLQVGYDRNKLKLASEPQGRADDRLKAGMSFWDTYAASQMPSGRDSTDLERVSGACSTGDAPRIRIDAQRRLNGFRGSLSFMDWQIIERVVGEGYGAADTMRILFASNYEDTVWARLREALDSLIRVS